MASPLSKGLFAHAIGESGGAFPGSRLTFPSLEQAEKRDEDYFSSVRSDSSLAALRAASSTEILELATRKVPDRPRFGPDIDGYFLPRSIPEIYAAGDQAHVPLIAGWNRDEDHTTEDLQTTAARQFGPQAEEFLQAVPGQRRGGRAPGGQRFCR